MHKATSNMQNIAVYSLLWHFAGREICNKKLWKVDSPPFRSTPPHKPKNKKVLPVPRPPLLMLFLAKEEEALIWILLLRMLLFRRKWVCCHCVSPAYHSARIILKSLLFFISVPAYFFLSSFTFSIFLIFIGSRRFKFQVLLPKFSSN